jgi:hypothetical protein
MCDAKTALFPALVRLRAETTLLHFPGDRPTTIVVAMGGQMLGHNRRATRSTNHTHDFTDHNVGADLRRQVCRSCGHVSIDAIPPADLRDEFVEVRTALFSNSQLTVRLADALEPVLNGPRFGERKSRR